MEEELTKVSSAIVIILSIMQVRGYFAGTIQQRIYSPKKFFMKLLKYFEKAPIYITTEANKEMLKRLSQMIEGKNK